MHCLPTQFTSATQAADVKRLPRAGSDEPLVQLDLDVLAGTLADRLAEVGRHRELVRPVAQCHKGAPEGLAVHGPAHFDQAAGAEELRGPGHHQISPASRDRALLHDRGERVVQRPELIAGACGVDSTAHDKLRPWCLSWAVGRIVLGARSRRSLPQLGPPGTPKLIARTSTVPTAERCTATCGCRVEQPA